MIDLRNFKTNIFDYGTRRTGRGQITADNFHDPGDSGQRITNLMGQASR